MSLSSLLSTANNKEPMQLTIYNIYYVCMYDIIKITK